jgi:thiosulfate sulfurtransferase
MSDINVQELAFWRKAGFDHVLIDVRRDIKRKAEADEISGTQWHNPAAWLDWKDTVAATAPGQPVVVYCAYGHELSQALAACLRALGRDARHLTGGIEEWRKAALPVVSLKDSAGAS